MCLKEKVSHNPLITGIKLTFWEWWRATHFISPSHDFVHWEILRELECIFLSYQIGPSSSRARLESTNDDIVILSSHRQGTDLQVYSMNIIYIYIYIERERERERERESV